MLTHAYIRNDVLYTHGTSVCACSQFGFLSAIAALNCICPRTRRWHWGGSSLQVEYENGILVLPIADTCFVYLCFYRALRYTLRSGSCRRVLSLDSLFFHAADQDARTYAMNERIPFVLTHASKQCVLSQTTDVGWFKDTHMLLHCTSPLSKSVTLKIHACISAPMKMN